MSALWKLTAVLGGLVLLGLLGLGWMLLCAEPLPTPDLSRRDEDRDRTEVDA